MEKFIITAVLGLICIVFGISHMKGNLSTLHSYHRKRVSEEDRLPFGRKVGLGTIICGISIIAFSILSALANYTENTLFTTLGAAVMIVGIVVGIGLSFYAMIKYNKGIF